MNGLRYSAYDIPSKHQYQALNNIQISGLISKEVRLVNYPQSYCTF
jgi:hypothetical protein